LAAPHPSGARLLLVNEKGTGPGESPDFFMIRNSPLTPQIFLFRQPGTPMNTKADYPLSAPEKLN
jgi:hypothetical protein